MKNLDTEVLVIGGGATGTGIARDLAMRGFRTILVEKGDLTHGTTGRYHGLLHSGGRYAVKDPQAALECIQENTILRKIMPHCLEDTGGFFVTTEWDDPEYADKFFSACQVVGIPVEEISTLQMLREEPLLNPKIYRCFRVPDASADSFLGAEFNAESARQHGAKILNYHKVLELISDPRRSNLTATSSNPPKRVAGALCHDLIRDEKVVINADMTVNASGAWVGLLSESIGINIPIIGGKGTMVAVSHRIVNTVINRCKMPSDGDILVPAHTVAVIGTTDVPVQDPDHYSIEPWEVRLCLDEGEKLVPGFKNMRMLRAWAGVRPLYQETSISDTREITRAFVLLDHAERDGVEALVTITSGKWTTYRKMAEATVDLVCKKLKTERACRTHLEMLPSNNGPLTYHQLGSRLQKIETERLYGAIICECELATRQDVERSIVQGKARTLDDIRRKVRLGMGPCQGGFCTYRAIGIIHEMSARQGFSEGQMGTRVPDANLALREFLQERWKGLLPVLWGQQLRQERLNEYIFLYVLNASQLPGPRKSLIAPTNYEPPQENKPQVTAETNIKTVSEKEEAPNSIALPIDVLVIGAGLSGLATAWQASQRGKSVRVVSKGWGANHWGTGCIDLLGALPSQQQSFIRNPGETLLSLTQKELNHPYAIAGLDTVSKATSEFQMLCETAGYPLKGNMESNWLLPTALGVARPTCLAPETMIAGDLHSKDPMLIVGFEGYHDFYPLLIAENLVAQGYSAKGIVLSLSTLNELRLISSTILSELIDGQEFIEEIYQAVKHHLKGIMRVGLPAVLGIKHAKNNHQRLEELLGIPVFEIPALPPSVPGIRLHNILLRAIQANQGSIYNGMTASGALQENNRIKAITTLATNRGLIHEAQAFVLATGGVLGGGIRTGVEGYAQDTVFGLPVEVSHDRTTWAAREFINPDGHPVNRAGLQVDSNFKLVNSQGENPLENLYIVGSALSNYDGIPERSLEGVSLASGYFVGRRL